MSIRFLEETFLKKSAKTGTPHFAIDLHLLHVPISGGGRFDLNCGKCHFLLLSLSYFVLRGGYFVEATAD